MGGELAAAVLLLGSERGRRLLGCDWGTVVSTRDDSDVCVRSEPEAFQDIAEAVEAAPDLDTIKARAAIRPGALLTALRCVPDGEIRHGCVISDGAQTKDALRAAYHVVYRDVPALVREVERLRGLVATCACGTTYATYEGPEADCPVHGAVRAYNEAQAELVRVRPVLYAAGVYRDAATALGNYGAGDDLSALADTFYLARIGLRAAVDTYREASDG